MLIHAGIYSISPWVFSLLVLDLKAMRRPSTRDKQEYGSRAFLYVRIVVVNVSIKK